MREKAKWSIAKDRVVLCDLVSEEGAMGIMFNLGLHGATHLCSVIPKRNNVTRTMKRRKEGLVKLEEERKPRDSLAKT